MREFLVPKKTGGFRKIYAPDKSEKRLLRGMVLDLEMKARELDTHGVVHGFAMLKSPVTNAAKHVGANFSVCFDLEDFFDSVTENHIDQHIPMADRGLVLINGAPRQGLPTSPAVANIAASEMDEKLWKLCRDADGICFPGEKVNYTRYADDLTFSCLTKECATFLLNEVPKIVKKCKFKINPKKTHVLSAKMGRMIITGVAVDHHGVHPTRRVKRGIRALRHQLKMLVSSGAPESKIKKKTQALNGLIEWSKNKIPGTGLALRKARSKSEAAKRKAMKSLSNYSIRKHAKAKAYEAVVEHKVLGHK